ncbi:MAG: hypothetical protein GY737_10955, partial [Desulfobacteraceae bacterium]|nr:hypothetical protein [Desulfobacteraceae bacterium]
MKEQRAAAQSRQRVAEELRQQQLDFQPLSSAMGSSSLHQTAWARQARERQQEHRSFPPRPGESWHQPSTGQLAAGSSQQQEQLQRPPPADPPVVPSLSVSSAPWVEGNCELLGCLFGNDGVSSVSARGPVALSSIQSVEASNSKENVSSLLPPFETIEMQPANADRVALSSAVNDELRATIRRLEAMKNDGRTA